MTKYEKLNFDEERALYGERDILIKDCRFDGPVDGESALKEAGKILADSCYFNLRYPFWHCEDVKILDSKMSENCRAALWYSSDINIQNSKLHGIKALRECKNVIIDGCDILSCEFGWFTSGITAQNSSIAGEYCMLRSKKISFNDVDFKGKYSFQYIEDAVFENCNFDTKDAFWHARNVMVRNSVVRGEYLAWYCSDVTFENCEIIGTQPLCYCKNLRLVNCRMIDCDLSFEKSSVNAEILGYVDSIKNPEEGYISVESVGEIIKESGNCIIKVKNDSTS